MVLFGRFPLQKNHVFGGLVNAAVPNIVSALHLIMYHQNFVIN